jgi:hypothetical protein
VTQLDNEAPGATEQAAVGTPEDGNTGSPEQLEASAGATDQQQAGDTGATETQDTSGDMPQPITAEQAQKLIRENARMARALDRLNKAKSAPESQQTEERDIDVSGKVPARQTTPAKGDHPITKYGLQPDGDGEVNYGGRWQNADDLYERLELTERLSGLERSISERDEAAARARADAEVVAAWQEVHQAIEADVKSLIIQQAPHIKDDAEAIGEIARMADAELLRLVHEGAAPSDEIVAQAASTAYNRAVKFWSQPWQKQLVTNEEYKETHRVKTGGQAGTEAPKTQHNMSKKELEAAAVRAYKRASSGQ